MLFSEAAGERDEEEKATEEDDAARRGPAVAMRRPAVSVRRAVAAALAILFGALVLIALVMDDGEKAALPVIGGRKTMSRADGEQRTLDGFKTDDTFQDSKRRVPNGPDPIHNRYYGLQITARQA